MTTLSPLLLSCLSLFDSSVRLDHFLGAPFAPKSMQLDRARRTLEWCEKRGVHILHPDSDDYPEAFFALEKPPLFLSVQGSLESVAGLKPRLAVVGTREPSNRALEWIDHHLSQFLSERQAVIVSGGARGIDQKAHRVAIREGAPTLVFLPSGLAKIYPSEIESWKEALFASGGALVSPYAPEQEIRRRHFEGRNRLIASLGQVVLIAEAQRRSGSIMTARLASELGRTLAVLPSFPGEPSSAGTLDLLFNGAFPLRDSADLLTLFDYGTVAGADFNYGLSPSTAHAEGGGHGEDGIRNPHRNRRRQLTFARSALGGDINDPIDNDQSDAEDASAPLGISSVGDRAQARTNEGEEKAGYTDR